MPQTWKDNPQLGTWCATQRNGYKSNILSRDRITRLEQLGFVWNTLETTWEEMFATLRAYKQTHGDCNVPFRWKGDPKLAKWCEIQRRAYNKRVSSPDRVKRLEELGFVWRPFQVAWEGMLAALTAYKQTHGDCNVPDSSKDNPQLGMWCRVQRRDYKKNIVSPDRIKRLEQLGFVWDPRKASWEEMFAALRVYKQTHGDCNVPFKWKDNPKLATWCRTQRGFYRNSKISPDRVKRLEELGFVWAIVSNVFIPGKI